MLFTQKSEIIFLEHCKVYVQNETLCYSFVKEKEPLRFNIPYYNTQALILGSGTSITQQAAKLLREGGVVISFSGGGMTPVFLASLDYKPNEFFLNYFKKYIEDDKRLEMAKKLFSIRLNNNIFFWKKEEPPFDYIEITKELFVKINSVKSISEILGLDFEIGEEVKWYAYRHAANKL